MRNENVTSGFEALPLASTMNNTATTTATASETNGAVRRLRPAASDTDRLQLDRRGHRVCRHTSPTTGEPGQDSADRHHAATDPQPDYQRFEKDLDGCLGAIQTHRRLEREVAI